MSLGYDRELDVVSLGDSAELKAVIYDEDDLPYPEDDLLNVEFTIQAPDGNQTVATGEIQDDGLGYLRFDETDQVGEYIVRAQFTTTEGVKRSVRSDFEVKDPFAEETLTPEETIIDQVWLRLEDCFDSEEGGPWLRDESLRYFNKKKIGAFIGDAILEINSAPPATTVTIGDFVSPIDVPDADPDGPILVQGTLLAVIRHLMRSYVEQPTLQGAQVPWHDRTQYLERWGSILQVEEAKFTRWLALWKRQFLGGWSGALLVSSKAGRLIPAPMRTRQVGRGYY